MINMEFYVETPADKENLKTLERDLLQYEVNNWFVNPEAIEIIKIARQLFPGDIQGQVKLCFIILKTLHISSMRPIDFNVVNKLSLQYNLNHRVSFGYIDEYHLMISRMLPNADDPPTNIVKTIGLTESDISALREMFDMTLGYEEGNRLLRFKELEKRIFGDNNEYRITNKTL